MLVFIIDNGPKAGVWVAERLTDSPERAQVFRNLAQQWLKLAIELEHAHALRDEFEPKPKMQ